MGKSIRRFTRLTNAFSKKLENHALSVEGRMTTGGIRIAAIVCTALNAAYSSLLLFTIWESWQDAKHYPLDWVFLAPWFLIPFVQGYYGGIGL